VYWRGDGDAVEGMERKMRRRRRRRRQFRGEWESRRKVTSLKRYSGIESKKSKTGRG